MSKRNQGPKTKVDLSSHAKDLFVRKYDDLVAGVEAQDSYEILKLGALLRHLLIDDLMHLANRDLKLPIRFRVNRRRRHVSAPGAPDVLIHGWGLHVADYQSREGTEDLKLDDFLALELIETNEGAVTVRHLISFAANKLGAVHLDDAMAEEDQRIISVGQRLQGLGIQPVAELLQMVARIVFAALGELRTALVTLPEALKVVAHYSTQDRLATIALDGRQYITFDPFRISCQTGFSWSGAVSIAGRQPRGRRVLYEARKNRHSSFVISVGPEAQLTCAVRFGDGSRFDAVVPDFLLSGLTDAFLPLLCQACAENGKGRVTIHHGENLLAVAEGDLSRMSAPALAFENQIIGADLSHRRGARFQFRELVLGEGCVNEEMRRALAGYFLLQWHA